MHAIEALEEFKTTNVNCKNFAKSLTNSVILAVNNTAEITESQVAAVRLAIFSSAADPNAPIAVAALQIATFINSCR